MLNDRIDHTNRQLYFMNGTRCVSVINHIVNSVLPRGRRDEVLETTLRSNADVRCRATRLYHKYGIGETVIRPITVYMFMCRET